MMGERTKKVCVAARDSFGSQVCLAKDPAVRNGFLGGHDFCRAKASPGPARPCARAACAGRRLVRFSGSNTLDNAYR